MDVHSRKKHIYDIAALLWAIGGLLWCIGGLVSGNVTRHVPVGMMYICVGILHLVVGRRLAKRRPTDPTDTGGH